MTKSFKRFKKFQKFNKTITFRDCILSHLLFWMWPLNWPPIHFFLLVIMFLFPRHSKHLFVKHTVQFSSIYWSSRLSCRLWESGMAQCLSDRINTVFWNTAYVSEPVIIATKKTSNYMKSHTVCLKVMTSVHCCVQVFWCSKISLSSASCLLLVFSTRSALILSPPPPVSQCNLRWNDRQYVSAWIDLCW